MKLTLTIFTTFLSAACFAQADSTTAVVATDTIKSKATLTLGASYANNASYYGQRALESMPYMAASATYRLRSGIYFSGMGYKLLNDSGSAVSASSLGAGISFDLSKNLSADISYSHTFYPSHSPFLQAANADNVSASLTLENWLSTTANVDYAFGKTQDIFVTLGTGKFINLGSLFSPKDFVSLTPAVDVVGGTQHFYETYVTEKKLRDSLLGILLPPVLGGSGSGSSETTTTSSTSFDLLSYNLKLPLAYNRAHYLLEAAYQLSVLGKQSETGTGKTNSFFTLSFYYQF
jgi:opacity protein-like surface antigen